MFSSCRHDCSAGLVPQSDGQAKAAHPARKKPAAVIRSRRTFIKLSESENAKQLAVLCQSTVCILCENCLGQDLTELYAFLVEAVDIPCEALEHNFILEMSEDGAECFRCQLVSYDDAGRSAACEILILVVIVLAACKCNDLSSYVGGKLLLAGRILDYHVIIHLIILETDELERDNICALMEQLIEGMLTVRAGLTEDDRSCNVVDRLAEAVD